MQVAPLGVPWGRWIKQNRAFLVDRQRAAAQRRATGPGDEQNDRVFVETARLE